MVNIKHFILPSNEAVGSLCFIPTLSCACWPLPLVSLGSSTTSHSSSVIVSLQEWCFCYQSSARELIFKQEEAGTGDLSGVWKAKVYSSSGKEVEKELAEQWLEFTSFTEPGLCWPLSCAMPDLVKGQCEQGWCQHKHILSPPALKPPILAPKGGCLTCLMLASALVALLVSQQFCCILILPYIPPKNNKSHDVLLSQSGNPPKI